MSPTVRPVTLPLPQLSRSAVYFGSDATPSVTAPVPSATVPAGPRTIRLSTLGYVAASLLALAGAFFGGKAHQASFTAPTATTATSASTPVDPGTAVAPVTVTTGTTVLPTAVLPTEPSGMVAPTTYSAVITPDLGYTDTAGRPILPPNISGAYFDFKQPIQIPPGVESIPPFRPVLPDSK